MSMIAMALGQVFFERNARLKNDKAQTAAMSHQLFDTMFWVALIPVVVLTVWGDQITLLLLGEEWTETGVYIQITMPFYFAMYLTTSFSSAFVTYNKLNVQLSLQPLFSHDYSRSTLPYVSSRWQYTQCFSLVYASWCYFKNRCTQLFLPSIWQKPNSKDHICNSSNRNFSLVRI